MKKWEYKTVRLPSGEKYPSEKEVDALMNECGKQGWELLAEPRLIGGGGGKCFLEFFFKRAISPK